MLKIETIFRLHKIKTKKKLNLACFFTETYYLQARAMVPKLFFLALPITNAIDGPLIS